MFKDVEQFYCLDIVSQKVSILWITLLLPVVPFFLTVPNFLLFYVHSEEHEREEGGVNKTFYLHSLRVRFSNICTIQYTTDKAINCGHVNKTNHFIMS